MKTSEISQTLLQWRQCTDELHGAIAIKNIKLFKTYLSIGNKHFQQVKQFISKQEINATLKEDILNTSDKWLGLLESLKSWKNDIGNDLNKVRGSNKAKSKVRNAYNIKNNRIGRHVNRKAR